MRTAAATILCCALSVRRQYPRDAAIFARMCSRAAHPPFSGALDGLCSPHRWPFAQRRGGRQTAGGQERDRGERPMSLCARQIHPLLHALWHDLREHPLAAACALEALEALL